MVNDTLIVKAWGETVAKIIENDKGTYDFIMNPTNILPFSPIKITKMGEAYNFSHLEHQYGLPGLISDSLPGKYGSTFLEEFFIRHFKKAPTTIEKLQILGSNTMGALTYEPERLHERSKNTQAIFQMSELYEETKKALFGESEFELEKVIALSNSAAGGAQPKAIVGLNPNQKCMYVGKKSDLLPDGFVHAIVKFDNLLYTREPQSKTLYDELNLSKTLTEYIYSILARKCGITIPETYLIDDGNGGIHFAVERFDIQKQNDHIERLHMHSLSGLMHHNPAETTFDYTNLFRVGLKLNIPHEDMINLYRIMIFNIVFANRDDHSKNFSYLMDQNGTWRAAPAYDLTFSPSEKHQMLFDYKPVSEINRKHLIKIADEFNIRNAGEMIDHTLTVKNDYLRPMSVEYGINPVWMNRIFKLTQSSDQSIAVK
jgi:serine/threonine-protein kinase HipA